MPQAIHFPQDGVRAVDVPITQITVDAVNRLVEFDQENTSSRRLSDKLSTDEQIKSIVIFTDVDIQIKDIYDQAIGVQAGWTVLQGIPDTQKFRIDATVDQTPGDETLTPKEIPLQIYLFTTEYEQIDISNKNARTGRKRTNISVTDTSYQTEMVVPGSPYSQGRIKVENTGSNELDARLSTIDAGETSPEVEKTQISEGVAFNDLKTSDFYLLELKESGNGDTTAKTIYRGESQ